MASVPWEMRGWLGSKQEIYSKDFYNNVYAQHWDIVDHFRWVGNVLVGDRGCSCLKRKES